MSVGCRGCLVGVDAIGIQTSLHIELTALDVLKSVGGMSTRH